jgi:acyl-CoA synthetase (NDP forming)
VEEYDGDESFPRALTKLLDRTPKPVVVLSNLASAVDRDVAGRLRALGIPVLEGTVSGVRALGHLLATPPAARAEPVVDEGRRTRWVTRGADDWPALLTDYGIGVALSEVVSSRDDAVRAAGEVGLPVVLKTAEPTIHHKTEVDGVRLGLGTLDAVGASYDDLAARLGRRVLVQRQVTGVEVALGIVRDPLLGPLVVVSAGGTLVELMGERAVALPPYGVDTARSLLRGLRLGRVLDGFRGVPAADVAALAEAMVSLGQLAIELGDHLDGLDLNPVVVGPAGTDGSPGGGALVVDALVLPR